MTVCIVCVRYSVNMLPEVTLQLKTSVHFQRFELLSGAQTLINYKEMEVLRMEQWDLCSGSPLCSNQLTSDSLCLFRSEFYFLYVIMFKVSHRNLSREVACANIT